MKVKKITKGTDIDIFEEIASLHKESLKRTIASTLSNSRLAKVYSYMVEKEILQIITAEEGSRVVGSLSYKKSSRKTSMSNLIFLIYKSVPGFVRHPLVWFVELYFKIGLYKGIKSKLNIVTLFIDVDYQNKKIGQLLVDFIISEYKNDITVDTRSNNKTALNFYKKNQFVIVNENVKNTVLKRS